MPRSVAPADWPHQMPFVHVGGSINMGIGRACPSPQATPHDPTPPPVAQTSRNTDARTREETDTCGPALKRTRIGPEAAPRCYAGSYMENIEALSVRGVTPALYTSMIDSLCTLYWLVEALATLYETSRDKLHSYSRLEAWLAG